MSTKAGAHVATGSRNGFGPFVEAAPAVVIAVGEGGALLEAREKSGGATITIYRDQTVYHDAPPGIDQMDETEARAAADFYWPQLLIRYDLNPATYYQVTNEYGGDNPASLRNLVAFETRLMELAERDGIRLAVGSCAGGSPGDWNIWVEYFVPLIRRAGQGGHIYSRHAYGGVMTGSSGMLTRADGSPADENAGRPFREAEYLRDQGILTPMVITEAGQNAGYRFPGVDAFMADAARYDQLCLQHENIWGFCAWTYGSYLSFPANIEAASGAMAAYLIDQGGAVRPTYPEPAIVEKPMSERGKPRMQYARKYICFHESIPVRAALDYVERLYNEGQRHTFGWSADDAGIGDLDVRIAELVNWPNMAEMRAWYATHYPGVAVEETRLGAGLPGVSQAFSSPVGTSEERQSSAIWPGAWTDATGFATRYQIVTGGSYHRHTGADLNLNLPGQWNADKGMPVYAAGDGVVTCAQLVPAPSTWGRLVVIRHLLPDGRTIHTRYGHMASFLVQEGQRVLRGDVIGTIGAAGLAVGKEHLHFDVSHSGILETNPTHWPGDSLTGVLNNYLDPKAFLEGKADALADGPAQQQFGPAGTIGVVGSLQNNAVSQYYPYAERPLANVRYLVIHHSAGNPVNPPASLAEGHINRDGGGVNGYPGIGYHYVITGDGKIYRTQRLETHSFHVGGSTDGVSNNGASVGVCLGGSFMGSAAPTTAQILSCRALVGWLRERLPGVVVKKHRDFNATDCPGDTWASWWQAATGEAAPTPPPATGNAQLGLHAGADSGDLSASELALFALARPGVVKVLSSHSGPSVERLARDHPGAAFIIRAFLHFGGRNITPAQFVEWTLSDVQRAVAASGPGREVWVELHNEPNLVAEGLGASWANAVGFSNWLLDVLGRYRAALPANVRTLFPGLSPGGDVPGVRQDNWAFLEACRPTVNACDGLAVHAYWHPEAGYPMASSALSVVDEAIRRFPGKPVWVTEASSKSPSGAAQGEQYLAFWQELRRRPAVRGVTYFVASGSHPDFQAEVWLANGQSRGIAEVVGSR